MSFTFDVNALTNWRRPYHAVIQAQLHEPHPRNRYRGLLPPSLTVPSEFSLLIAARASGAEEGQAPPVDVEALQAENLYMMEQWWLLRDESESFRTEKEKVEEKNASLEKHIRGHRNQAEIEKVRRELVEMELAEERKRGGARGRHPASPEARQATEEDADDEPVVQPREGRRKKIRGSGSRKERLKAMAKELEETKQLNVQLQQRVEELEEAVNREQLRSSNLKRKAEEDLEESSKLMKLSADFAMARVTGDRKRLLFGYVDSAH